ncbi:unnamed protein product, partial [Brenthis ino]
MADNSDLMEELSLEQIHRKEKKELQAQIQALKKAAKNDKTKKKELVSEIAKLEADLEMRHKKELELVTTDDSANLVSEFTQEIKENDNVKPKISKAQKRRDKKIQQEKSRELEIKLQEQENINGPRNIENQAILSRLKERNLKMYSVPSDGDCLYKAVVHQLERKYNKVIYVNDLRKMIALHILENKDDFMPFLSNSHTNEMLTDNEFKEYCNQISNTKVWGGQLEIRAISNVLKCPITVIQATGPEAIEQGTEFQGPPLILSYHRHMYSLGEHYNSTEPLPKDI